MLSYNSRCLLSISPTIMTIDGSVCSSLTGRVFFHRFPALYEFLLQRLQNSTADVG